MMFFVFDAEWDDELVLETRSEAEAIAYCESHEDAWYCSEVEP